MANTCTIYASIYLDEQSIYVYPHIRMHVYMMELSNNGGREGAGDIDRRNGEMGRWEME
jgi:hypothetical protein